MQASVRVACVQVEPVILNREATIDKLARFTAAAGMPGTLRALIHKGGLRADILSDGEIRIGDEVAHTPLT